MKKLYIARRRGLRRVPFYASPEVMVALVGIRDSYRKSLGREVSTSVIARRALLLLQDHLEQQSKSASCLAIGGDQNEAAAVFRCAQ
jgi:hypothetical protein